MKQLIKDVALIAFCIIIFFVLSALALCGWKLIEVLTQKLF